ncbi:MAG: hypothetical protein RIQ56_591 [Candidatus Parcubacteria bacterium]
MNPLFTSALTGFFVFSGVGGFATSTPETQIAPPEPTYKSYTVSMTGYNAVPEQTDDTPFQTSIGAYTNPEIIVARSKDLADELPYGTVIRISQAEVKHGCEYELVEEYIGLRVVADAMHPRKRNQIDVLLDTKPIINSKTRKLNAAQALGYCRENIVIEVIGKIDTRAMPKSQKELKDMMGVNALAVR